MRAYAETHHEWVQGVVIRMSPVTSTHDRLTRYLSQVLSAYLALRPTGQLREEPFVMRLDAAGSRRQPDLMLILDRNPNDLTETYLHGPADVVIEVVSAESASRDYGDKFVEYERGGVGEYWIIDPTRAMASFYRLSDDGVFQPMGLGEGEMYETPLLPGLRLHVPTLWEELLPTILEVTKAVEAMLGD
jgi:Uma2 family endonuclease